jgi:hypothetical protein
MHWMLCALLTLAAADVSKVNQLGPVKVTSTLSPAEPTLGDEITFEIRVEAEPQVEVLMPEFGEALNRYSILNFVPRQSIDDRGKNVLTQQYTLQPYLSGPQTIPPILIEFVDHRAGQKATPEDADAYEILTDAIAFEVKSVLPKTASNELKPPLGELELPVEVSKSHLAIGIGLSVLGVAAGLALWVVWRRGRQRARRRNAYEVARARLDQLLSRPMPQDAAAIERFFVDISAIVRRYLEDRFELRAPELTTEEFLGLAGSASQLSASQLSADHQNLLRDFLKQADLVKFAGVRVSEAEIRRSSDLAGRFLEETRENAPWVEETTNDSPGPTDLSSRDKAVMAEVLEDESHV